MPSSGSSSCLGAAWHCISSTRTAQGRQVQVGVVAEVLSYGLFQSAVEPLHYHGLALLDRAVHFDFVLVQPRPEHPVVKLRAPKLVLVFHRDPSVIELAAHWLVGFVSQLVCPTAWP